MKTKAKDVGREHIGLHVKDKTGSWFKVIKISLTQHKVYLEGLRTWAYFLLDEDVEFMQPTKTVELTQEEIRVILGLIPEKWKYGNVAGDIRAKLDNL